MYSDWVERTCADVVPWTSHRYNDGQRRGIVSDTSTQIHDVTRTSADLLRQRPEENPLFLVSLGFFLVFKDQRV